MRLSRITGFGVVTALLLCGSQTRSEAAIGDQPYCENFEGGSPYTFTSDHAFFAPPAASNNPSPLFDTLTYSVDTNPNNWHAYWDSFGDHTSGAGNMMIVNAADFGADCDVTVFQSPVINVYPNTTYTVSYWVALSYIVAPPGLTTSVNGAPVGTFEVSTALSTTGDWTQVSHTWNSGSATTAQIRLCDTHTVYQGDDYALDDICLTQASNPICWAQETGWSAGSRYVQKGNWATFTEATTSPVTLWGGQTMNAGTVTFSAASGGQVTITITLNDGWRFSNVAENVKIQGYDSKPSVTPNPGGFSNKAQAGGSPYSMTVSAHKYYGVHVDLERSYECR